MAMTYRAKLNYAVYEDDKELASRRLIAVDSFEVDGGAFRTIKLKSTDDISISSELEQARTYKNVNLFLPSTKDGTDVEVADRPVGGHELVDHAVEVVVGVTQPVADLTVGAILRLGQTEG